MGYVGYVGYVGYMVSNLLGVGVNPFCKTLYDPSWWA